MSLNLFNPEYKVLGVLGRGAYGFVVKAVSRCDPKNLVAIKVSDIPVTHAEMRFMQMLDHENIVKLIDCLEIKRYRDKKEFYHVELVMELCISDLHVYNYNTLLDVESKSKEIIQVIRQIVSGLSHMHDRKIIHCDLKPSNILISESGSVKICDFSISKVMTNGKRKNVIVQTVYYAAPEVLTLNEYYNFKIDIWSLGCIMYELYAKAPLFDCNDREMQFSNIAKICGGFSENYINEVKKYYNDIKFEAQPKRCLKETIRKQIKNRKVVWLIDDLLQMDPFRRPSAKNILCHPLFIN